MALFSRWFSPRPRQPAPLPMVVGVGRSGTTLLRLMLDAHPRLAVPAETGFLAAASALSGAGDELREAFFGTATSFPNWPDLAVPADEFGKELIRIEPFSLTEGARCFYRRYARRHGKPRCGDKTPPYALHLDRLHRLLPEARFIHLIRDGRDVARSFRGLWFSPGDDMRTLAQTWRDTIRTARELAAGLPHYLEVRYERLVTEPAAALSEICAFVGLRFHGDMLRYHRQARDRLGEVASRRGSDGRVSVSKEQRLHLHRRTSEAPDAGRVGLWRDELSAEEVGCFEEAAGDLLEELGYPLASRRPAA